MKEAIDKMLAEGGSEGGAESGQVDLSPFEEGGEDDEDQRLTDSLTNAGFNASPEQVMQIKEILKGSGGEGAGATPPPDNSSPKPKSKMDALFAK